MAVTYNFHDNAEITQNNIYYFWDEEQWPQQFEISIDDLTSLNEWANNTQTNYTEFYSINPYSHLLEEIYIKESSSSDIAIFSSLNFNSTSEFIFHSTTNGSSFILDINYDNPLPLNGLWHSDHEMENLYVFNGNGFLVSDFETSNILNLYLISKDFSSLFGSVNATSVTNQELENKIWAQDTNSSTSLRNVSSKTGTNFIIIASKVDCEDNFQSPFAKVVVKTKDFNLNCSTTFKELDLQISNLLNITSEIRSNEIKINATHLNLNSKILGLQFEDKQPSVKIESKQLDVLSNSTILSFGELSINSDSANISNSSIYAQDDLEIISSDYLLLNNNSYYAKNLHISTNGTLDSATISDNLINSTIKNRFELVASKLKDGVLKIGALKNAINYSFSVENASINLEGVIQATSLKLSTELSINFKAHLHANELSVKAAKVQMTYGKIDVAGPSEFVLSSKDGSLVIDEKVRFITNELFINQESYNSRVPSIEVLSGELYVMDGGKIYAEKLTVSAKDIKKVLGPKEGFGGGLQFDEYLKKYKPEVGRKIRDECLKNHNLNGCPKFLTQPVNTYNYVCLITHELLMSNGPSKVELNNLNGSINEIDIKASYLRGEFNFDVPAKIHNEAYKLDKHLKFFNFAQGLRFTDFRLKELLAISLNNFFKEIDFDLSKYRSVNSFAPKYYEWPEYIWPTFFVNTYRIESSNFQGTGNFVEVSNIISSLDPKSAALVKVPSPNVASAVARISNGVVKLQAHDYGPLQSLSEQIVTKALLDPSREVKPEEQLVMPNIDINWFQNSDHFIHTPDAKYYFTEKMEQVEYCNYTIDKLLEHFGKPEDKFSQIICDPSCVADMVEEGVFYLTGYKNLGDFIPSLKEAQKDMDPLQRKCHQVAILLQNAYTQGKDLDLPIGLSLNKNRYNEIEVPFIWLVESSFDDKGEKPFLTPVIYFPKEFVKMSIGPCIWSYYSARWG